MPPLIYFLLSLAIAIFGINRKFGFWGYLFGSLLLSPIIGFLLVISSDTRKKSVLVDDDKKIMPIVKKRRWFGLRKNKAAENITSNPEITINNTD